MLKKLVKRRRSKKAFSTLKIKVKIRKETSSLKSFLKIDLRRVLLERFQA